MDSTKLTLPEGSEAPAAQVLPTLPVDAPAPKRKGKKLIFCMLAVGCAAACIVAFALPKSEGETVSTYKESKVTRGDITAGISETGTISIDYQTVKYNISQTTKENLNLTVNVEEVFVKAGQKVSEGDPLIRISTEDLREQLSTAQLTLKQAQASLEQARLDQTLKTLDAEATYQENQALSETAALQYDLTLKQLENDIATYEDDILDIQKQIKILKGFLGVSSSTMEYYNEHYNEYNGSLNLDELGNASDEPKVLKEISSLNTKLETARNALEEAKLSLETKKKQAELTLSSEQFTSDNADTIYEVTLAQIENSLTTAQLKVESAQNDISQFSQYLADDGIITSPLSGTIMTLGYSAGDEISSNTAIAIISNPLEAYISVSIVQEDITSLELEQAAQITLDAFPDQIFTGKLDSMSVQPSRTGGSTVSYTVNSLFDAPSEKFFEGMTGDVTFITTQLKDVLIVTNRAIVNTDGVQTVKVMLEDGAIEEREITTGFSDGRNVEVLSGLQEGDTVLIESQVAAS